MSTLHKVKAYFGMAPMDDYDDEYYDDRAPSRGFPRTRFDDGYGRYDGRDYDDPRAEPDYPPRRLVAGGYRATRPVQWRNSSPPDGRGALCWVPAFLHCEFTLTLQKNPEGESVCDQQ